MNSYEVPELRVLGSVESLTKDGVILKHGMETDIFSALNDAVTGSNVQINPEPPVG